MICIYFEYKKKHAIWLLKMPSAAQTLLDKFSRIFLQTLAHSKELQTSELSEDLI